MPELTQKGAGFRRDEEDAGVSGAVPPSGGLEEASSTTNNAFDFTITLGGAVAFERAEILSVSDRFDLETLKHVTDVELRLSRAPEPDSGQRGAPPAEGNDSCRGVGCSKEEA